jgi:hypothetical protein
MLLIAVELIEGVHSPARNMRMIEELTDATVESEGESSAKRPASSSMRSRAEIGASQASR